MTDQDQRFTPNGTISIREAVVDRFRALEPREWISEQELHSHVEEVTEATVLFTSFKSACWQAGETLVREGDLGVDAYMGGYRRHDAEALADSAEVRLTRATRDLSRMDIRAAAALTKPELPPWRIHRLQLLQAAEVKQKALAVRRQNRHRPLPPAEKG